MEELNIDAIKKLINQNILTIKKYNLTKSSIYNIIAATKDPKNKVTRLTFIDNTITKENSEYLFKLLSTLTTLEELIIHIDIYLNGEMVNYIEQIIKNNKNLHKIEIVLSDIDESAVKQISVFISGLDTDLEQILLHKSKSLEPIKDSKKLFDKLFEDSQTLFNKLFENSQRMIDEAFIEKTKKMDTENKKKQSYSQKYNKYTNKYNLLHNILNY